MIGQSIWAYLRGVMQTFIKTANVTNPIFKITKIKFHTDDSMKMRNGVILTNLGLKEMWRRFVNFIVGPSAMALWNQWDLSKKVLGCVFTCMWLFRLKKSVVFNLGFMQEVATQFQDYRPLVVCVGGGGLLNSKILFLMLQNHCI